MTAKGPAVEKAGGYLIRTQKSEGSWFVNSRAYQRPELSSYMGTAWATLALVRKLPEEGRPCSSRADVFHSVH